MKRSKQNTQKEKQCKGNVNNKKIRKKSLSTIFFFLIAIIASINIKNLILAIQLKSGENIFLTFFLLPFVITFLFNHFLDYLINILFVFFFV